MESQPQNPEFRINPEIFHPCTHQIKRKAEDISYSSAPDKFSYFSIKTYVVGAQ